MRYKLTIKPLILAMIIVTVTISILVITLIEPKITAQGTATSDHNVKKLRANKILQTMTLEQKVGQMFLIRCPKANQAAVVQRWQPGGLLLFAEQFKGKTKSRIVTDIENWQKSASLNMLVGVDEEGGTVNRLSIYRSFRAVPFWGPQQLYKAGGWKLIESDTLEKAQLLKSLGINLNLAPVADVSMNPDDYIYKRTFGKEAVSTVEYVKRVVHVMNNNSIGSVLKHFPGYGNNRNTHTGLSIDKRSYRSFESSDFLPFSAGIAEGAGAVLVSHNIVTSMDSAHPASLSVKVHQILRNNLGYDGVILTDDLVMEAIRKYTKESEVAVAAVEAGNDMLCSTDYEVQLPAVLNAVKARRIPAERIDASVQKILLWKLRLGILK